MKPKKTKLFLRSCFLVRKQVEKMKTFDEKTLAEETFSENSPEENRTCAEEDEEKEETTS